MLKSKKGFTLIELLAVIVVLAIIGVIAVKNVSDALEKATASSFESSYNALLKEVKNRIKQKELGINVDIVCDDIESSDTKSKNIKRCSEIYQISEDDYEMIVQNYDKDKYLFSLLGKGKFDDLEKSKKGKTTIVGNVSTSQIFPNVTELYTSKEFRTVNVNALVLKENFEEIISNNFELKNDESGNPIDGELQNEDQIIYAINRLVDTKMDGSPAIPGTLISGEEKYGNINYWEIRVRTGSKPDSNDYEELLYNNIFCYYLGNGSSGGVLAKIWINKSDGSISIAHPDKNGADCLGRE